MQFVIERSLTRERNKYPFTRMEKGDSFTFSPDYYTKIRSLSHYYGKKLSVKFSVCKEGYGFRVTRIK